MQRPRLRDRSSAAIEHSSVAPGIPTTLRAAGMSTSCSPRIAAPRRRNARQAIEARASLLAAGIGRTLIEAMANRVGRLDLGRREAAPTTTPPTIVDLGCGSGDALAALTSRGVTGIGIDLSTAAIEHAARRFPDRTWVVANADRRLPLLDGSIDIVMLAAAGEILEARARARRGRLPVRGRPGLRRLGRTA